MSRVELLSPAGTYDCFRAALNGGADAVYMGLKRFGARASAGNFDDDEIIDALNEAHLFEKKIYLTINTLYKDDELCDLLKSLEKPYLYGLDGVIVQDLGAVKAIKEYFPKLPVHGSTQMAITDSAGVRLAGELGIERVVPARELSLDEIRSIRQDVDIELECFVHGAMCYSYSGKCLFSSFLGGRSGNRGRCAQPCRLIYDNEYLLSMKDMSTIELIPKLIEAGIDSFKIEGRMKSPEYVYGVTSIYRKYIDLYYSGSKFEICSDDINALHSLYTRAGNCKGYYFSKNGRKMITINSPSYNSDKNHEVIENITESKSCPINLTCRILEGRPVELIACIVDEDGKDTDIFASSMSEQVIEKANKSPATVELVEKQLRKTGNTFFAVDKCDVFLEGNVFVPNVILNQLRRDVTDTLFNLQLEKYIRLDNSEKVQEYEAHIENKQSDISATAVIENNGNHNKKTPVIRTSVSNYNQLRVAYNNASVSEIVIPYYFLADKDWRTNRLLEETLDNKRVYVSLPYIIREDKRSFSEKDLRRVIDIINGLSVDASGSGIVGVYVSNYESLSVLADMGFKGEVIGDVHLYALNKVCRSLLDNFGVNNTTVPIELNERELIKRGIFGEDLIVYGRVPMMVSTQCVKCTRGECNRSENGHWISISDRKGASLPVFCDCNECCNIIYNSVPTFIADEKQFISKIKPATFRICFTDESDILTGKIIDYIIDMLNGNNADRANDVIGIFTRGHLHKGVE